MSVDLQYLTNPDGKRTAVIISMDDWRQLSKYVDEIKNLEEIGKSIKQGLKEAKAIESGNLSKKSLSQFLDEL